MMEQIKLLIFLTVNFVTHEICHENPLFSQDVDNLTKEVALSSPAILQKGIFRDLKMSTTVPDYDMYILTVEWGSYNNFLYFKTLIMLNFPFYVIVTPFFCFIYQQLVQYILFKQNFSKIGKK